MKKLILCFVIQVLLFCITIVTGYISSVHIDINIWSENGRIFLSSMFCFTSIVWLCVIIGIDSETLNDIL